MLKSKVFSNPKLSEFIFQLLLLILVFVVFISEREKGNIYLSVSEPEFLIFLNYAAAAYVINYLLLPKFLYRKKYLSFSLGMVVLLAVVIFLEEAVIEKIYFPTTRGSRFPGVAFNLLAALPTITILAGFKFAWDALTKQSELEKLQLAVKESELQFLKTQINPHFLFNNLNNLYAYALEQSPKTPEIILELSGLLRYMLYECQEKFVSLSKEVGQLENFINLSQLQLEERGEVKFTASGQENDFKVAPLLLSVFVENAFKHSLSSVSEDILIDINLDISDEGKLDFLCKNTFSETTNNESLSKGIGLDNVKKRLEILYPKAHTLEISTTKDLYKVRLSLQLQKLD